jgi:hypothetical protein
MKFTATTLHDRTMSSAARLAVALMLAVGALGLGGCTSLSVQRDIETIVTMAPEPVMVKQGQEFRAAEAAAQHVPGAQAFRGVGDSMEPLYVSGTAIVVMPCAYSQLRAGMSVVYVNHNGRGVAHVLTNEMPGGWIAQGVNNREEDDDLVTANNLVGVITQAYASADTPMRREIASRAALKATARLGGAHAQLALNLPKAGAAGMVVALQDGTR